MAPYVQSSPGMDTTKQPIFLVTEPTGPRPRLLALMRPVLIVPHALLVGGPFVGLGGGGYRAGLLGLVAATIALFDWFAILFTGHPLTGLQGLKRFYLAWRTRVLTYGCFLRDEYPPFGDGAYPASLQLPDEPLTRDRLTVGLRPLLLLPHLIVLALLLVAGFVVAVISWLSLGITGQLDSRLWRFSRDVVAYALRVESYALLLHDQFPPFQLGTDARLPTSFGQDATTGAAS